MDSLHICLFGKFEVRFGERVLCGFQRRKVQELFGYLLLNRNRPLPRETLAGLLWDDGSTTSSKKQLRQTLWQLQAALEPECEPVGSQVLRVEPDWVYLDPAIGLWLDVAEFEKAFALAQGIPGQKLDAAKVEALQDAVQLYHGDLLEGCYQDWCLYERERLLSIYLAMLDKLMGYCEAHRKYELGLAYGARLLSCDPASERAHRRLMRLQYLAGDRTAALRQYQRCVAALDAELGAKPSKHTVALWEQIRADQSAAPNAILVEASPALGATTAVLPRLLDHLRQLRAVLSSLQLEVDDEIQVVQQLLEGPH